MSQIFKYRPPQFQPPQFVCDNPGCKRKGAIPFRWNDGMWGRHNDKCRKCTPSLSKQGHLQTIPHIIKGLPYEIAKAQNDVFYLRVSRGMDAPESTDYPGVKLNQCQIYSTRQFVSLCQCKYIRRITNKHCNGCGWEDNGG